MKYNKLGKTGLLVSSIGFGAARLPEYQLNGEWILKYEEVLQMVTTAYSLGINYFDSGDIYCHGQSQKCIAEGVKPFRDKIILVNKVMLSDINCREDFEKTLLKKLSDTQQEYFDIYFFWGIGKKDIKKLLEYDLLGEAEKAKKQGRIRHIGFSFHDAPDALIEILDHFPQFEVVLCQYNALDRTNESAMKEAYSRDVGVLVMSPLAGGRLLAPVEAKTRGNQSSVALTLQSALKFVIDTPFVSCTLSGFANEEMICENVRIVNMSEVMTTKERNSIIQQVEGLQKLSDLYCTGCDYCQPCPQGINISRYFKQYTLANVYKLNKAALDDYLYFTEAGSAPISNCIGCHRCEQRCPQRIEITKKLPKVDKFFMALNKFYELRKAEEEGT